MRTGIVDRRQALGIAQVGIAPEFAHDARHSCRSRPLRLWRMVCVFENVQYLIMYTIVYISIYAAKCIYCKLFTHVDVSMCLIMQRKGGHKSHQEVCHAATGSF